MIPLNECIHGSLYRLLSPPGRFRIGIFDAETRGFIGIRLKDGIKFLDTDYHKEVIPETMQMTSAMPTEQLGLCPINLDETELLLEWMEGIKDG